MTVLFNSKKSGDVTSDQLLEKLKKIGASDCDILYIHSNLNFGLPSLKRSFLLEEMYSSIEKTRSSHNRFSNVYFQLL